MSALIISLCVSTDAVTVDILVWVFCSRPANTFELRKILLQGDLRSSPSAQHSHLSRQQSYSDFAAPPAPAVKQGAKASPPRPMEVDEFGRERRSDISAPVGREAHYSDRNTAMSADRTSEYAVSRSSSQRPSPPGPPGVLPRRAASNSRLIDGESASFMKNRTSSSYGL
jgi:hypothetical protein